MNKPTIPVTLGANNRPLIWMDLSENKHFYTLDGIRREEFPDSVTSHEERCVYVETMWRMA